MIQEVGGGDTVFGVAVNTNDNLVYTALSLGKFGVYNSAPTPDTTIPAEAEVEAVQI